MSTPGVLHWVGCFLDLQDLLNLRRVSRITLTDITLIEMLNISTNISVGAILDSLSLFSHTRSLFVADGASFPIDAVYKIANNGIVYLELQNFGKIPFGNGIHADLTGMTPNLFRLRHLHLKRALCDGVALLEAIKWLGGLRTLYLENIHQLTDSDLRLIIQRLLLLEIIDIKKCMMLQFFEFPPNTGANLLQLSITECPSLSSVLMNSSCSRVERLCLDKTAIAQDSVEKALLFLPTRSVELRQCSNLLTISVTNPTVQEIDLRACAFLRRLELSCPSLNRLDILLCQQLNTLILSSSVISYLDVTMLTSLRLLSLSCQRLQTLDVSGCIQLSFVRKSDKGIILRANEKFEARERQLIDHMEMLYSIRSLLPLGSSGNLPLSWFASEYLGHVAKAHHHQRSSSL